MKRTAIVPAVAAALTLSAGVTLAADQQETIYGSQIMTQQGRNEQRAKMRAAKTPEEREQVRKEHHERMQERAKAQGVTLPASSTPTPRRHRTLQNLRFAVAGAAGLACAAVAWAQTATAPAVALSLFFEAPAACPRCTLRGHGGGET